MVQRNPRGNTSSNKSILPVIVPAFLLIFLTGAVRTYTFLAESTQKYKGVTVKEPTFSKGFNSTEETFAQYATVLTMLNQNQESEALAKLGSLVHEPISMEGNTFHDTKLGHFSPQTLLLSVSQRLAKGAQSAAKNGDHVMAQKYVDALYGIGEHVLSTPSPTLQGIESAHHFLGFAARIQASVFAKGDYYGVAARYREWALETVWQKQFSPRIEGNEKASSPKNDKLLAATLAQEYRDSWSQIRAGEA